MLTSSHAYWTWRLGAGRWAVLGAAAPDLPAIAAGAILRARGDPGRDLLRRVYHERPSRDVQYAAHSALVPAALAALGRPRPAARALATGWAGHLAIDLATHVSDAWPPLWPLATWRRPARISYWDPRHRAREFAAAEAAAIALAAASDPQPARRAAGMVAALVALGPALGGRRSADGNVLTAAGLTPDRAARGRDLGEPRKDLRRPSRRRGGRA